MNKDFLHPSTLRIDQVVFSKKYNEEYYTPYRTNDNRYMEDTTQPKYLSDHFDFLYDLVLNEYLVVPKYETSRFDTVRWIPSFNFMAELFDIKDKVNNLDEVDYFIYNFEYRDNVLKEIKSDEIFIGLIYCCQGISNLMKKRR